MQTASIKGFHLSLQQERMWLWQKQKLGGYAQVALLVEGCVDFHVWHQAVQQVMERHSILRTVFYAVPGMEMPLQVIRPSMAVVCPVVNLETIPPACQLVERDRCFAALREAPFDLARGPLIRCAFLRFAPDRHLLLLSLSALLADTATLAILTNELFQTYTAISRSNLIALDAEDLPFQYTDVSAWQNELLQEDDAASHYAYWDGIDLSALHRWHLPFEEKLPHSESSPVLQHSTYFQPQQHEFFLPPSLWQEIEQMAGQLTLAPFAFLVACWQCMLWRVTKDATVLVGLACDGRHYEELSDVPGLYTRYVPLSASISERHSFQQVLSQLSVSLNETLEHQEYFTWHLSAPASSSTSPVAFPFACESLSWSLPEQFGPLHVHLHALDSVTDPFTLQLFMLLPQHAGPRLQLRFDPARLSLSSVQSLSDAFLTFVRAALRAPQAPIMQLPLLSHSQQRQQMCIFTGKHQTLPAISIQQLFEQQVAQRPEQLALVVGEESYTYRSLNEQANRLAHLLRARGVGANVLVPFMMERGCAALVALLAVLKAGGAYVPLEPALPVERVEALLHDLQAPFVLSHRGLYARLPGSLPCLDLDEEGTCLALSQQPTHNPACLTRPEDLAYVLYTSGSTGLPKGVMIQQSSLLNYVLATRSLVAEQPGLHFGCVSTLAADLGNTVIYGALLSGGCLHLLPYEVVTDGVRFANTLARQPLDVLKIVPSHLRALMSASQGAPVWPERCLILGGEAFPVALWQDLRQRGAHCRILNHYGPTETTVGVLLYELPRNETGVSWPHAPQDLVPLGRPLANTAAYVLDDALQLVPPGSVGELYLAGAGLAAGYLRQPEQTQERFIQVQLPDLQAESGTRELRLYKTGDLVRTTATGDLIFVGRADRQVKMRGYRIELGEIEAVIQQQEEVWECAVQWWPLQEQLVAYIVPREIGDTQVVSRVRAALQKRLPAYMLPGRFVCLSALPLTANGKVDFRALPEPSAEDDEVAEPSQEVDEALTPVEEIVAQIWCEVLKRKRTLRKENFFELGGHSLLATQVISRVRQLFGVELPIISLFETPVLLQFSKRIERALRHEQQRDVPAIVPVSRHSPLPLSFAQQRLWFLNQLDPGSISYNKPIALLLEGNLHVRALVAGLRTLVQRHEILRTTYQVHDGQAVQVIGSADSFSPRFVDLRALSEGERSRQLEWLVQQEAQYPFNLARGPLLCVTLILLASQQWAFLLKMHHIVSDGWSNSIFISELAQCYEAIVAQKPVTLPPLPVQYADFAFWQRQWLQGEVLEHELAYWRAQLNDVPPLRLPTDRLRPPIQTMRGAHVLGLLPLELTQQLKALSQQEGVTLFMTLLAAFQLLLARYSGQEDIAVGTPIANRTRAEVEGLIGFFINTLVLRTDLSGDPSFQELLRRVREVTLGAYAHQDVPFEKLVEVLQPERDLSHAPLFQVMLTMQNAPRATEKLPDVHVRSLDGEIGTVQFDLVLLVTDTDAGLHLVLVYNADLFEASTIARFLEHWQALLASIVSAPTRPLSLLSFLTPQEHRQLLVPWKGPGSDYLAPPDFARLFAAQVERTPDAIALTYQDHLLSYATLNQYANQLAYYLHDLGVGPDVLVGLCVERSLEMLIGMLGILKAGGVSVPLDPGYPAQRLALMLKNVSVLVTQQHLQGGLPVHAHCQRVCLDTQWDAIRGLPVVNPASSLHPQDLAYVIYTSGSTGEPKGVMVSHFGLANLLEAQRATFLLSADDVVLQFASLSFDASVWEILMALGTGARLCLGPSEAVLPGPALASFLCEQAVTVATLPPSALSVLPEDEGYVLRTLVVAGEDCSLDLVRRWAQGRRFFNAYGPSEATVCASIAACPLETTLKHPSIGQSLRRTSLYVLDASLQPVATNIPGELYIGGVSLARGYLSQPERTAERFIPHPFSEEPGARLYKTGDLVRYCTNGDIEFLGRVDQQVKVRGFRIEPGEIEQVLLQISAIRECLVLAWGEDVDAKQLVAYCVVDASSTVSVPSWRDYLKDRLPEYMQPAFFVVLDTFPLLPNGKIDRHSLPDPRLSLATTSEAPLPVDRPLTQTEELLVGIWRELMRLDDIGLHDNFFELGGHSLLATRLISRIKTVLLVDVPLSCLFECPTIAELAPAVEEILYSQQDARPPLSAIIPAPRTQLLPLSFSQQRLWFLDQLEPGNTSYNIPIFLRLHGHVRVEALERSFQQIMQRHEVLRTTFAKVDGQAVQVVAPSVHFHLHVQDLRYLELSVREMILQQLIEQELQRRFDLVHGPLFFATLVLLEPSEYALLLSMHHIVSDAWSNGIFVRELTTFYRAEIEGTSAVLSPLPIQYADFAFWQRQWLQGEVLEHELAYWRGQLAGVSPLDFPSDFSRPPFQTAHGAHTFFLLPLALTQQLKALAQQEGVTLFMTLLAVFQLLLARYSGQEDIAVGTPIANRTRAEVEGLIGFFMNTLVLRTDLSRDPSFQELLQRVREVTLGAYAHQDIPFEKLVEALQPERDLSRSPLFQVMFTLQNTPDVAASLPDLHLSSLSAESGTAKFDITLFTRETSQGLSCRIEYNTDLFKATTIHALFRHWQCLLDSVVADPSQRISQLSWLSDEERAQLLHLAKSPRGIVSTRCLHQLFEAQVQRIPDALAVVEGEHAVTYACLESRANQLARRLHQLGVEREQVVGAYVERSLDLCVALLGIFKAGGAIMPLDPGYPRERLALMMQETQAPVLVTQRHLLEHIPTSTATLLLLDELDMHASSGSLPGENERRQTDPEQLAYIIYTSGSTGRPKGVAMGHAPVVNLVLWQCQSLGIEQPARTLQWSATSFDILFNETFTTWHQGGSLHIVSDEMRRESGALLRYLHEEMIERAFLPYTALHQIAEASGRSGLVPDSLRAVLSTAEALQIDETIRRFFASMPSCRLYNEYGPSESHVVSGEDLERDIEHWEEEARLGRGVSGSELYVLDRYQNLLPVGVVGELYLGGKALARGYIGRPGETAEKFLPNRWSELAGGRMYRTGDMVNWEEDGRLRYRGRRDEQVKLRGYRIELGEIESVLRAQGEIASCVVVVREDHPGDKRLVAYLVAKQASVAAQNLSSDTLRAYVRQRLPEYEVPSAFVLLDALPLTPSGKVDRRSLPAPEGLLLKRSVEYIQPQTYLQQTIASLWQEVLYVDKISLHDNFFDLGGHSLLAVQVHSRLQEILGRQFALLELFKYPTVSTLAHFLHQEQDEQPSLQQIQQRTELRAEAARRQRQKRHMLQKGE